jgi:uncharacterized membrane protein
MEGGLHWLTLNMATDRQPGVGDIFKGFSRYGSFLSAFWLFFLIYIVCAFLGGIFFIPLIITCIQQSDPTPPAWEIVLAVVGGTVFLFALIQAMLRYYLAWWILCDDWPDLGVIDAFKLSSDLTEGHRGQLFLLWLLAGLFAIAGILALCVGLLVTGPVAWCVLTAAYLRLKRNYLCQQMPPAEAFPPPAAMPPPPSPTV